MNAKSNFEGSISPRPTVDPECDGISFDWQVGEESVSINILPSGELNFAWATPSTLTPSGSGIVRTHPALYEVLYKLTSKSTTSNVGLEDKLHRIFAEQLGVPESDVTNDKAFVADLGADSLDTVELVMAVEDEFGIEIPDIEAEKLTTVGLAVEYVSRKLRLQEKKINTKFNNFEQALSVLMRQIPCPHENYESVGDGTSWMKCEDCGQTISKFNLEKARISSKQFDDAAMYIRNLIKERI